MAEGSQNIKMVRESGAFRNSALTFRRLGERLRLVSKGRQTDTDLVRVIETEILPRLMLVHQQDDDLGSPTSVRLADVSDSRINEFVDIIIDRGTDAANEVILDLVADGLAVEDVFLKLMGPAARVMSDKWVADELSFVDVTIGLCRLHELLRNNSIARDRRTPLNAEGQPSILLSVMPGDQHLFGVQMAAEFFRRDGWQVVCETVSDIEGLAQILANRRFDAVGLSLATGTKAANLDEDIDILREASSNG
ncbi:MAG: hypothetical protein AAGF33_08610, partial [Pseudomonadota bacterium]